MVQKISEDCFRRMKEGDINAFREVFEAYYQDLYFFASQLLHYDSYAEDITVEALNKAWEDRARQESAEHLENYLFFVTRNGCLNYLRGSQRRGNREKEWARRTIEEDDISLDRERIYTEVIGRLTELLDRMPGGEVVRLSYLEKKSTEEISRQLDKTENNIYVIKKRTLDYLRKHLGKDIITVCCVICLNFWPDPVRFDRFRCHNNTGPSHIIVRTWHK